VKDSNVPVPRPTAVGPKPAEAPAQKDKPRLSEGVRNEIEANGWAIDPVTGKRLDKSDL
jgi:hypothetical protein